MEKQNKYLVWGVLSLIIPLLLYIFVPRPKTEVLSENISQTPLVLPEPSAQAETASPTLSPTPIPTKTPEPLPTPTPVPPAEINALIDRFSAEESSQTAAYALSQGKRVIWPHCAP